jgi:hypothetical protein
MALFMFFARPMMTHLTLAKTIGAAQTFPVGGHLSARSNNCLWTLVGANGALLTKVLSRF